MTSDTPATTAPSNGNYFWPKFDHLVTLVTISVISIVVAVALGIWSLNLQVVYTPNLGAIATVSAFSDALLLLGVIAGVGAIVLAGVRALLASPELIVKVRRNRS